MNIFAVDNDPHAAASMLCDAHVNRMLVESCQLLASVHWHAAGIKSQKEVRANTPAQLLVNEVFAGFPRNGGAAGTAGFEDMEVSPYWPAHMNHPCAVWARASADNYDWLVEHAAGLHAEYSFRYGNKTHACACIVEWFAANAARPLLPGSGLTPFYEAMPDQLRSEHPVEAYRNYYIRHKANFAKWARGRDAPGWYTAGLAELTNA